MFNKINQQGEIPKNRAAFSRNLHAKSKLTVFMVYKMIEKQTEQEPEQPCSSFIFKQGTPQHSSTNKTPMQTYTSSRRRENTKTENSSGKFECFQDQRMRNRCDTQTQTDNEQSTSKCPYRIKNHKTIEENQSLDFNRLIIERMKKAVKTSEREQTKMEQVHKLVDFGLNIRQAKRFDAQNLRKSKHREKKAGPNDEKQEYAKLRTNTISNEIILDVIQPKKMMRTKAVLSLSKRKLISEESSKEKQFLTTVKYKQIQECNSSRNLRSQNKKKDVNSYQKKMQRMFDCLDIILNSFHCKIAIKQRPTTNTFKNSALNINESLNTDMVKCSNNNRKIASQKYYYYIGGGNNCNLIRSILRKRSWWSEVDSITKANFVWTQLRNPQVLSKLKLYDDTNWLTEVIPYEEQQEQNSLLRTSGKKSNSTANSQNLKIKQSSIYQLFHEKQDKRYHTVLEERESDLRLEKILTPELIHNHYEHNYMFGNKNALQYNLTQYYDFAKKDLANIIPLTFYIDKSSQKSMAQFEKIYLEAKKKNSIWIVKPAENSNRGQGIQVTTSLGEIKLKLNTYKKIIVQAYIKNLLLYNGRKFDIRTYMIALTVNGRLKVYWYDEGYIRTSSEMYDLTNLLDPFIHLTNDAIQKNGQNYGKYEQGNKLSYSEFQRYLQSRFGRQNLQISVIHDQMKELARDAVKAIYCRLDPAKKQSSFQLFGLDFIIDSQFKPYLIEINTNPCLELSSPCLQRLIPRMMQNIFRICIDPIFRPQAACTYAKSQSYYIYDESFLDRNKFGLIFDQKYDRDFEWQQRCRRMSGLEWGQGEQEQYDDEGSLIVVDY